MKINFNFTFKKYKILNTYKNLNSKFLIITNSDNNNRKIFNFKKNSINEMLNQRKVTNKAFIRVFKISVFKNFKKIINGQIFFIKLDNNKKNNKKNLPFFNSLAFKLNNKIYSSKKFFFSNFLTYKENIILLFQLNIVHLKFFLKN